MKFFGFSFLPGNDLKNQLELAPLVAHFLHHFFVSPRLSFPTPVDVAEFSAAQKPLLSAASSASQMAIISTCISASEVHPATINSANPCFAFRKASTHCSRSRSS